MWNLFFLFTGFLILGLTAVFALTFSQTKKWNWQDYFVGLFIGAVAALIISYGINKVWLFCALFAFIGFWFFHWKKMLTDNKDPVPMSMAYNSARPGSDLAHEQKTAWIGIAALTVVTILVACCFFVFKTDLNQFAYPLKLRSYIAIGLFIISAGSLTIGFKAEWDGKVYGNVWFWSLAAACLLAYGTDNM